jgi:hypothetical protein
MKRPVIHTKLEINEWLLVFYSVDQVLCPVMPTGISWLRTFGANGLFCDMFRIKLVNVKLSKHICIFSQSLNKDFSFHYL